MGPPTPVNRSPSIRNTPSCESLLEKGRLERGCYINKQPSPSEELILVRFKNPQITVEATDTALLSPHINSQINDAAFLSPHSYSQTNDAAHRISQTNLDISKPSISDV